MKLIHEEYQKKIDEFVQIANQINEQGYILDEEKEAEIWIGPEAKKRQKEDKNAVKGKVLDNL